ncbi:MAG: hypothetical protein GKS02_12995 [Alphaproteobacteria bacterium]|nr:hypothetical protein [Alphaproteobacteria bacterium]
MAITLLYASLLALWFVILSVQVIRYRGSHSIDLGDGGDTGMLRRIRAHGNFVDYAPLALILMGLLEVSGAGPLLLHVIGGLLLVGRLAHGWALSFTDSSALLRTGGIALTLAAIIIAAVRGLMIALDVGTF